MAFLDPQIAGAQPIAEFGQRTELILVTIDLLFFPDCSSYDALRMWAVHVGKKTSLHSCSGRVCSD